MGGRGGEREGEGRGGGGILAGLIWDGAVNEPLSGGREGRGWGGEGREGREGSLAGLIWDVAVNEPLPGGREGKGRGREGGWSRGYGRGGGGIIGESHQRAPSRYEGGARGAGFVVRCDFRRVTTRPSFAGNQGARLLEQKVPASYVHLQEIVGQLAEEQRQLGHCPMLHSDLYRSLATQRMEEVYHRPFRDVAELNQATNFLHENGTQLHTQPTVVCTS